MTDNTVLAQVRELIGTETNTTANLANASALLKMHLSDINWAGFYLFEGEELVLGPFQGLPACIRIPLGKGVCGTAAEKRTTIIVPDVHLFPGHIACDAASRSEIVVPLVHGSDLFGVLDVDSAVPNRFTQSDRVFLEAFASVLMETLKGDKAMEYRIEKGPEYRLTGLSLRANSGDGSNFTDVPAFWDTIMRDGRFSALCAKIGGSKLGICGVCHSFDMKTGLFTYTIAIETPADRTGLPESCEDITVPASNWAKFTSRGPLRPNFQETIKRIYSEWFPTSGKEHAGTAEIEFYPEHPEASAADYWCEYWVPLKNTP